MDKHAILLMSIERNPSNLREGYNQAGFTATSLDSDHPHSQPEHGACSFVMLTEFGTDF